MSNKVYDILKWVAIIVIPTLGKVTEGIFGVWGIPYGAEIKETLEYLSIGLGMILGISAIQYKKGQKNG